MGNAETADIELAVIEGAIEISVFDRITAKDQGLDLHLEVGVQLGQGLERRKRTRHRLCRPLVFAFGLRRHGFWFRFFCLARLRQIGVQVKAVNGNIGAEGQPAGQRQGNTAGQPGGIKLQVEACQLHTVRISHHVGRQRHFAEPVGRDVFHFGAQPLEHATKVADPAFHFALEAGRALGHGDETENRQIGTARELRRKLGQGDFTIGQFRV